MDFIKYCAQITALITFVCVFLEAHLRHKRICSSLEFKYLHLITTIFYTHVTNYVIELLASLILIVHLKAY